MRQSWEKNSSLFGRNCRHVSCFTHINCVGVFLLRGWLVHVAVVAPTFVSRKVRKTQVTDVSHSLQPCVMKQGDFCSLCLIAVGWDCGCGALYVCVCVFCKEAAGAFTLICFILTYMLLCLSNQKPESLVTILAAPCSNWFSLSNYTAASNRSCWQVNCNWITFCN